MYDSNETKMKCDPKLYSCSIHKINIKQFFIGPFVLSLCVFRFMLISNVDLEWHSEKNEREEKQNW